jgi:hypothetical protein
MFIAKLGGGKNNTSWKRRMLTHKPTDEAEVRVLVPCLEVLGDVIEVKMGLGMDITEEEELERNWVEQLHGLLFVEASLLTRLRRNTLVKRCRNVDDALDACGVHGAAMFYEFFGFLPSHMRQIVDRMFVQEFDLSAEKRGRMGPEEAGKLMCARLHGGDDLTQLGSTFGRRFDQV